MELVQGQIVGNLDQKGPKSCWVIKRSRNLGKKDALIKGDILGIYRVDEVEAPRFYRKMRSSGDRIRQVYVKIVKMKREIGADVVNIHKMSFNDPNLFVPIFQLLTRTVEPY